MGALHDGHRSLIRLARARGDLVVVSIFVNPLQFGPGEDYARYPRPLDDDLESCEAEGVDVVFVPRSPTCTARPAGHRLGRRARQRAGGASRPGHFDGVLTVVLKLFHIVGPHWPSSGRRTPSSWPASSGWCST